MNKLHRVFFFLSVALPAVFVFHLQENRDTVLYADERDLDSSYVAPFVPTPHEVVDRMLELAEISKGDVLYDLGSGDGRIVIAAVKKYGVKAVGFEIDPALVKESRQNIKEAGLEDSAEIREQDVRTVDFSPASVVTMYLYPGANLRLRPELMRQLKPGSRVVSHDFAMGSWEPDRVVRLKDAAGLGRTIYLWRIEDSSRC
ncbi:MAG: class I SAM-dependent methyltransferase [Candidatus Binatia bacterium]